MAEGRWTPLLAGGAVIAVAFAICALRFGPPGPMGVDAPAGVFSAGRAVRIVESLAGDGVPHPLGTDAAGRVRDRILAEFSSLGVAAEQENVWFHAPAGRVMHIRNVIARIDARPPRTAAERNADRKSVLIVAHYDSVPAGPGAGDDASGVAVLLEVARALKASPALRRPVLLLLNEGEEAGLLGARAFLEDHPDADAIHAVINVEARGTRGPSLMFETGANNRAAIALFAGAVARPISTSLFYTFYRKMPNDTDFTVFKAKGLPGFNFAFIGNVAYYHTPRDTVANLDPGSLQHHGDNVLALVRALADGDADLRADGDAVFFDVCGFALAHWPEAWTLAIAAVAILLLLAGAVATLGRGRTAIRRGLGGLGAWAMIVGLSLGIGYGLPAWLVSMRTWSTLPAWSAAGGFALALGLTLSIGAWSARLGFWALWHGAWLSLALAGAAVAWWFPGAAYLLIVPSCIAGVIGFIARALRRDRGEGSILAAGVPLFVMALLAFPVGFGLMDAFGPPTAAPAALIIAPLLPLVAGVAPRGAFLTGVGLIAGAALLTVLALVIPRDSEAMPHRVSLVYNQVNGEGKWWAAVRGGALPPLLAAEWGAIDVANWEPSRGHRPFRRVVPLTKGPALPALAVPLVTLRSARRVARGRRVRLLVTSSRGADMVTLMFPPDYIYASPIVRVGDSRFRASLQSRGRMGYALTCMTLPEEGIEIDLTVRPAEGPYRGFDLIVTDTSFGLPPGAEEITLGRDRIAVASGDGELTVVTNKISIRPRE